MFRPGSQAPFLGREIELERIDAALAEASAGRGRLMVLAGESGSGTTSLALRAAERAASRGAAVAFGRSLEGTLGRPFGALAEALESFALGLPAATLHAQLGASAPPLLRVLPGLREVLPAFAPPAPLAPPDERLRLGVALADWLDRATAGAPLVLVLDDLQHADVDLLGLLGYLCGRAGDLHLLVLGTLNGSPDADRWRPLAQAATAEWIEIEGLDEAAIAAMLTELHGVPVGPAVARLVQSITGGLPLFADQLFRHLAEEGLLPRPGRQQLPAEAELPASLEAVVAWRVSRLGLETRTALLALAAFESGAPPQLLAKVSGVARTRLIEAIEAAVAVGLVDAGADESGYAVAHGRIRQALLAALSPLHRAQLHRRVATTLEDDFDRRAREHAGLLAHHWLASAALAGAEAGVGHCLLAAEQSRSAYAHARAVACVSMA
ncbi:MAG TPA: AAA family ATPase, partial [Candidatus Limnocylindria bacterium]|nr:AAA family ATPase [Candidatus Limnocylindria bacterium]